jgi:ribosomal protein S18 acetylase RimI-like enzyme
MNLIKLDMAKHDLQKVSEMIYETDQNLFETFLDKKPILATRKLRKLMVAGRNCYGHEHIYISEDHNGMMMGVIVAFRGDEINFSDEKKVFWDLMRFTDFLKLALVKPVYDKITASSIQADDFYIGNLVVTNELRGHGIGSKLLKRSFQLGVEKKCKRVLLDVTFENVKAKKLYEKIGFNVCGEKNFSWLGKSKGTYGMEYLLE